MPKPLRNRSRKNAETSLLEPIRKKEIYAQTMRNRSQKTAETLLLEPTKNAEKRKMPKRCIWNLLKTKKRLPQARQTFAQRKTWKPASHQAKLKKKVFGTRMRKGRTPAGFVPKPLRNRSRKNAETSLLEPIKKKEIVPKPCETAARKLPKRCFWNLLKTKKKSRLKQGKPLRNVRLGSLQATRPNSRKRCLGRACEKAEPQQVLCPSHCETVAGKMPKRRCWNPLKRERNRAQTMRNRSQKTAETLLLDPTKNKEKTCKPPGQTQEKGVWDAHAKRQNPSRFCAQAIAKPQPKKCRNVAVGAH